MTPDQRLDLAEKVHCEAMNRMLVDLGNEMTVAEMRREAMRLALEAISKPVIIGVDMGIGEDRGVSQLVWIVNLRPCTEYPDDGLEVLVFNPGAPGIPAPHHWRRMYRRDGHWIMFAFQSRPEAQELSPNAVWVHVPPAPPGLAPTQQPVDPKA